VNSQELPGSFFVLLRWVILRRALLSTATPRRNNTNKDLRLATSGSSSVHIGLHTRFVHTRFASFPKRPGYNFIFQIIFCFCGRGFFYKIFNSNFKKILELLLNLVEK